MMTMVRVPRVPGEAGGADLGQEHAEQGPAHHQRVVVDPVPQRLQAAVRVDLAGVRRRPLAVLLTQTVIHRDTQRYRQRETQSPMLLQAAVRVDLAGVRRRPLAVLLTHGTDRERQ